MSDANSTPPTDAPETVDQHPDYIALPKKDLEEMDTLLASTQEMQNEVDKWCGVMGGAIFFLARGLLSLELQARTMKRENRELLNRVRALEDSIS